MSDEERFEPRSVKQAEAKVERLQAALAVAQAELALLNAKAHQAAVTDVEEAR